MKRTCAICVLSMIVEMIAVSGMALPGADVNEVIETLKTIQENAGVSIQPAQLKQHILEQTHARTDVDAPNVKFMIDMFERLLRGDALASVMGHTNLRSAHRVHQTDTIRSFGTTEQQGKKRVLFYFNFLSR